PIVLASPLSDAATTEIYTLSLHDALPICRGRRWRCRLLPKRWGRSTWCCLSGWCLGVSRPRSDNTYITRIYLDVNTWLGEVNPPDRKSTRLNSSHVKISYAVFCLKKKKHI